LYKEQQHSKKQDFFVVMVEMKLFRVFKPAGLTVCIFLILSVFSFCLPIWNSSINFCTHEGNMLANFVSDGNAAHGSSASVMEVTKAIELCVFLACCLYLIPKLIPR
jgi:hypothetical protein